MPVLPEDPQVRAIAAMMINRAALNAPGRWWRARLKVDFLLDKTKTSYLYLGHVQGDRVAAVEMAKEMWPQYIGKMNLILEPGEGEKKPLPNVRCELCQAIFPRERQRQKICPCCDFTEE